MMSNAAPAYETNVDTILTLPERTGAIAIADACREAAVMFVNDADRWGKAELAMWLMGPYAQLTQYAAGYERRRSGEIVRPVLLREIDARMVDRVVKSARKEVLDTLARTSDPEGAASFGFTMMSAGFVVRCEDKRQNPGWLPTTDARRLADRVLSLFAADALTRPSDYEYELSICAQCQTVDFDASARLRGICDRHGNSMFVRRNARTTMPYLPEGA